MCCCHRRTLELNEVAPSFHRKTNQAIHPSLHLSHCLSPPLLSAYADSHPVLHRCCLAPNLIHCSLPGWTHRPLDCQLSLHFCYSPPPSAGVTLQARVWVLVSWNREMMWFYPGCLCLWHIRCRCLPRPAGRRESDSETWSQLLSHHLHH